MIARFLFALSGVIVWVLAGAYIEAFEIITKPAWWAFYGAFFMILAVILQKSIFDK